MSYKEKYLKYKTKYSLLKKQIGGSFIFGDYSRLPALFNFDLTQHYTIKYEFYVKSFYDCYLELYSMFYKRDDFNINNLDYSYSIFTSILDIMIKIRVFLDEMIDILIEKIKQLYDDFISTEVDPRFLQNIETIIFHDTDKQEKNEDELLIDSFYIANIEDSLYFYLKNNARNYLYNRLSKEQVELASLNNKISQNRQESKYIVKQYNSKKEKLLALNKLNDDKFDKYFTETKKEYNIDIDKNPDFVEKFKQYYKFKQNKDKINIKLKILLEKLQIEYQKLEPSKKEQEPLENQNLNTLYDRFLKQIPIAEKKIRALL
jgi:hypothetical protein